jgi:hypothetical protein
MAASCKDLCSVRFFSLSWTLDLIAPVEDLRLSSYMHVDYEQLYGYCRPNHVDALTTLILCCPVAAADRMTSNYLQLNADDKTEVL